MKFVNFKVGEEIHLGIKTMQGIIDVVQAANDYSLDIPTTLDQVMKNGEKSLIRLSAIDKNAVKTIQEDKVVYAPSVINPGKIICVGLNYASHTKETKIDIPSSPVLFSKFNNTLAAHNQDIRIPRPAKKVDYEAELVIVIGKEAVNVSSEDALSYVFGYTVGNDLSARDLQFKTGQWLLGKSCDNFAPIGPYLVTADEIDSANLDINCRLNGVIRQSANTRDMIFDCAEIISYISHYMTLKPGDIIFTGTPGGVILGYPEDKQEWLKPGDKIAISIQNIGTLVNVIKES